MHFLRIWRVFLIDCEATGEPEIDEVNLLSSPFSEAEQDVASFHVVVDIAALVDVLENVENLPSKTTSCMDRKSVVVLNESLIDVSSKTRKDNEAVFDVLNLVRSTAKELWHSKRFQTMFTFELLDVLLFSIANVELHLDIQRTILLWLLESI